MFTKINYLIDIWFWITKVLNSIDKQGHYFSVRTRVNSNTKIYIFYEKETFLINDLLVSKHLKIRLYIMKMY